MAARVVISPKHSAALLRMGNRYVLVGISGDRMASLTEVTDAEEVATLTARLGVGAGGVAFEESLARQSNTFATDESQGKGAGDVPGLKALQGTLRNWKARIPRPTGP